MTVAVEEHAGIKVLRLHGELVGEHGDFVTTATELLAGRGTRIVVDLADVPFMNSTGLAALVRVTAQANVQESRVVLARPTPFVAGVLQTTQLDRFFEIYPTLEAALAKLQ